MDDAPQIEWIADNESLAQACQQWQDAPYLGLDTEFIRTSTFYPIPGLIQAGHDDQVMLIDPLAITDWTPFRAILENTDIIKVMHAAGEDLEVFQRLLGTLPDPVFDTQLAVSFLGTDHCMGYQRLVERFLGVELAKDETRSDWLARPLSDNQVRYAALDVYYLNQLYPILTSQLADKQRLDWHREDCDSMIRNARHESDPGEAWRDAKLAWKLYPRQLAVLRAICQFREKTARQLDVPRNKVIHAASLWPLARYQPDSLDKLKRIERMTPAILRVHGPAILAHIREALKVPESEWPERLPAPLPKRAKPWVEAIRNYCHTASEALQIARELIPVKLLANTLVRQYLDTGEFTATPALLNALGSWRRETILDNLIVHLNNMQQQSEES